jgi:hypothetical protein
VAEWLRRGLQILPSRFDSGRGLHYHLCLLFLLEYCRLILPLFSTTKKSGRLLYLYRSLHSFLTSNPIAFAPSQPRKPIERTALSEINNVERDGVNRPSNSGRMSSALEMPTPGLWPFLRSPSASQ